LIASGTAKPDEIAIASASPAPWDDHFHALAADAGMRLHFVHGFLRSRRATASDVRLLRTS
jgi:hypothetical protein